MRVVSLSGYLKEWDFVQVPKKLQPGGERVIVGRPVEGELRNCKLCGAPRPYRVKKGLGHYCIHCVKKQRSLSIRAALQGLAVYGNKYTAKEMCDRATKLLVKYLDKNPEGTVKELLPDKESFTADDLIEATFTMLIREVLRLSDDFECIGEDIWQLKPPVEFRPKKTPKLVAKKKPGRVNAREKKLAEVSVHPIFEDYPTPWIKVYKNGKLVRYEDAHGRAIPEQLWPTKN